MNNKVFPIIQITTVCIFLLLVFIYFLGFINPALIDFNQQPIFLSDDVFFNNFLDYSGGIADYISLFFSQFFLFKFWGSLILTASVSISMILTWLLLRRYFSKTISYILQFIPGLILINLHSHYSALFNIDLIFIVTLALALIYSKFEQRTLYFKIPLVLLSAIALFFLFGSTSLIFYSVLIIAIEIFGKRKADDALMIPFMILFSATLLYIISKTSAHTDLTTLLKGIISGKIYPGLNNILIVLFSFIPVLVIISVFTKSMTDKITINEKFDKIVKISIPVIILLVTLLIFKISFDKKEKDLILINYYAKNENWDKVLDVAKNLSFENRKVIFQVNRALYHKGKLLEQAFSYPQYWGEHGLILTTHYNRDVLMLCSDLYYDMGHVKGSLHWAYEAQTKLPYSPDVLKRIALTNLILAEYSTAEKFLAILTKSVIHKKWASKYILYLNDETSIKADKQLSEKRELAPNEDFFSNTAHPQYDLFQLIIQHPENKMAFEYYILDAMLIHNLAQIASLVKNIEKLNYNFIPTHIAEALLLFMTLNDKNKPELGKYSINQITQDRFIEFSKILMKYKGKRKDAQSELYQNFGNSFWYYIQYISPITTKREIKEK